MRRIKGIALALVFQITMMQSYAESPEVEITREPSFAQSIQSGAYASFDSMNAGIADVRYGIVLRGIYIQNRYPLIEGLIDINGIIAFQASTEPSVELIPGIGINTLVRLNLVPIGRCRLFIEGGFGLMTYTRPFPEGGTILNGARQTGAGLQIRLSDQETLTLTTRWYHTSNADVLGRERNPGLDSLGLCVGYTKPF